MEVMSIFKPQSTAKSSIIHIPVSCIKPNPYQPRKVFDHQALRELSASIAQYGVLQPISVRRHSVNEYELVAGERRLRAVAMAGLLKVPAIVMEMADDDSAVIALIENLQRQDLSYMEEAQAYQTLICEHGFTQEELAAKVGKNQSTIANKLRLLKLPESVKKMVADNELTERHARALLRLGSEQAQLEVLAKVCARGCNVKETDKLVDAYLQESEAQQQPLVRPRRIGVLKDVRIFINTIKHAVTVMRESGIEAESFKKEYDSYYEYTIKIPKNNE